MEFIYAIDPYGLEPVFQLNRHIGGWDEDDGVYGIDGETLSREILTVDKYGARCITILVNSLGGNVNHGYNIFGAIAFSSKKIKVIINGFAYSTAGWCILSADKIVAYSYSSWMCHMPYRTDGADISENAFTSTVINSIASIIAEKSGRNGKKKKTVEEVIDMMQSKTYYTAQEMYDNGLIDEVIQDNEVIFESSLSLDIYNNYDKCKKNLSKFVNSTYKDKIHKPKPQPQTQSDMSLAKIANKLKIDADSGEREVIEGIASLNNKVDKQALELQNKEAAIVLLNKEKEDALKEVNDLKTKLANKETEVGTLTEQKATLENAATEAKTNFENLQKEKDAAVAADLENKIATEVETHVNAGRISDTEKSRKAWSNMLRVNFDDVSAQLSDMPVNMHVPKPTVVGKDGAAAEAPAGSFKDWKNRARDTRQKDHETNVARQESVTKLHG